jgi:DnaD/phage-associated family protein
MGFRKEKTNDYFLLDTSVENIFINEYMASAPGDFVKVYMFTYMYAGLGAELSSEDIAKHLSMDIEDVLKAWTYWERMGVVRKLRENPENKLVYDIEFVNLKEQLYGEKTRKKTYSSEDSMQTYLSDREIQGMFSEIEKITGRTVSGTEMVEVLALINDFNASPEVIVYGYSYCVNKNKKNFKYISAVIKKWTDEGLRDVIAVEKHLSENDKKHHLYKRVFRALGFARNATEEEMRIMDTWFETMGFTIDKVLTACSKTSGISSPNINYVNKILVNWYEEQHSKETKGSSAELTTSEIMQYYETLVRREEQEAEERRAQVYSKVPRIKEIEEDISRSSSEISKIIISDRVDKEKAMADVRNRIDSLNMERAFLLTDNGFEMDYMDIKYRCPQCKDTGMLETGERCQCFREITKEKINLITQQNPAQ